MGKLAKLRNCIAVILCILCAFVYAQEADSAGHEISHGRRPVETQTKPEALLQWRGEGSPPGGQGRIEASWLHPYGLI